MKQGASIFKVGIKGINVYYTGSPKGRNGGDNGK